MKYIAGAYWDKGCREINEDSLAYYEVKVANKTIILGIVSDGIGGLKEGETASGYVVEMITKKFINDICLYLSNSGYIYGIKKMIVKCIYECVEGLKKYADMKGIRLGATLSMIIIVNSRFIIFQLGDSGIYLCSKHRRRPMAPLHINEDKSVSKSVSSFFFQKPYIKSGRVRNNQGFLLCSDGFYKKLDKEQILNPEYFNNELMIENHLKKLALRVKKLGEKDNISALYIKADRK